MSAGWFAGRGVGDHAREATRDTTQEAPRPRKPRAEAPTPRGRPRRHAGTTRGGADTEGAPGHTNRYSQIRRIPHSSLPRLCLE
eukprot:4340177-Pyramimonas_sp.AAC.1